MKKIEKNIFKGLKINNDKISDKLSMNSYSKWDSLNHLKLIIALEENLRFLLKRVMFQKWLVLG